MYITERDKYLLKHIEENGSLSLINAANLFFYGHKDNASRRLNQLVKAKKLKSYRTEYDFLTHQEKIFILPGMKKVKEHELLRENFKTLLELQFTDDENEYVCEDSISLTALIVSLLAQFGLEINSDKIIGIVQTICSILIILGLLNDPTDSTKGYIPGISDKLVNKEWFYGLQNNWY